MKAIKIGQTYDDSNLTDTGHVFHLRRRRDGRYFVSATYRTRWQGSRTDERWEMDLPRELTRTEANAMAKDIFADFRRRLDVDGFYMFDSLYGDDVYQAPFGMWCRTSRGYIVQ